MSDALDDMIGERLAAARGDAARLKDLAEILVSGLSLTIAMAAAGDPHAAGESCESATAVLFELVAAHGDAAPLHDRGAA